MKYSRPAARPSPLVKLLAEQRTLVIGVGAGIGVLLLLALIAWLFFGARGHFRSHALLAQRLPDRRRQQMLTR